MVQKISLPTHGRSLEILRVRGLNTRNIKGKYEAKLEFLEFLGKCVCMGGGGGGQEGC